jgi:hypothetical protein
VFALLFAQGGAQAHAYSHLHGGSDPAGAAGNRVQICAECLLFAPVLATAGSHDGPAAFRFGDHASVVAIRIVSPVNLRSYHAFRSRAPPTRL